MRVTIISRLAEIRLAARELRFFRRDQGMPEDEAAEVELAVVEAMNNAVLRAYRGQEGGKVQVEMTREPDGGLVIAVTDWGKGFDFPGQRSLATETPDDSGQLRIENGRGLMIMNRLMDRLEYQREDGANTLRLYKRGAGS